VHGQFVTVKVVLPDTVAVNGCTCPTITVAADGLTVTVTTFTLELLHPPKSTAVHANAATAQLTSLRHSITHFSLMLVPRVSPTHRVAESRLMSLIMILLLTPPFNSAPGPSAGLLLCRLIHYSPNSRALPKKSAIPATC